MGLLALMCVVLVILATTALVILPLALVMLTVTVGETAALTYAPPAMSLAHAVRQDMTLVVPWVTVMVNGLLVFASVMYNVIVLETVAMTSMQHAHVRKIINTYMP